ncbi:MAG: helix-hairpin-helix domain-containing protein [Bacilli bacterium]|nr:helix-hairpin-helix domain-containing protein [Bacilli bacterium]
MKEKLTKYLKYIILFIVFIALLVCVFYNTSKNKEQEVSIETSSKEELQIEPKEEIKPKIKIDIKGEIVNPGVYELDENTRVIDAINKSGGLTENADTNLINLSKTLTNEMVIVVYNKNEIEKLRSELKETKTVIEYIEKECTCPDTINNACINEYKEPTNQAETKDTKVNINTATLDELTTIPGIGETKAKDIIEYRNKQPFEKIEDITNIKGIGKSTFEKLKNYITI